MRILSEEELDAVYGGDGNVVTFGTVQVTATRLRNTGGVYWSGAGSTGFGHDEIGGGSGSCWNGTFTPIFYLDVPSVGKVRCMVEESAAPGFALSPNHPVAVVNSWAFGAPDGGSTKLQFTGYTNAPPGPEWQSYAGFSYTAKDAATNNVVANSVSLFPAGMISGNITVPYPAQMPDGSIRPAGTNLGQLSIDEHTVLTMGHEAAHQNSNLRHLGLSEAQAEGYGQLALENYRARKGAIDSKCRFK